MGLRGGQGVVAGASAGCAALLLVVLALSGPWGARSQAYLPDIMADAMDAAMFLNKFKQAAEQVGYADALQDPDFVGTIFAPVDQGFDALLAASNATWDDLLAANDTLAKVVKFHIIPSAKYYPLSALRDGAALATAVDGYSLYVSRAVPGIIHMYAVARPDMDPLNFATVLQYQEIKGGKAILYVVDKVLIPPAKPNTAPPAGAPASAKKRKMMM